MNLKNVLLTVGLSLSLLACATTRSGRSPQSLPQNPPTPSLTANVTSDLSDRLDGLIPNHDIEVVAPVFKTGGKNGIDWDVDALNASPVAQRNYVGARPVLSTHHCNLFSYGMEAKTVIKKGTVLVASGDIMIGEGGMKDHYGNYFNYSYMHLDLVTPHSQKLRLFCEVRNPDMMPYVLGLVKDELKSSFDFPTRDQAMEQYQRVYPTNTSPDVNVEQ